MAKKKKRKIKFGKIFLLIILIGILIGGICYLTKDKKQTKKVKKLDTIKGYDYTLSDNATSYYKKIFKQLKDTLEKDNVDENKYAELVTKLFISDLYNLDNKINRNDVGGKQFVYKDFRDDFTKYAKDSIYKDVEINNDGKREQKLPVVTDVQTEEIKETTFKYGDKSDDKAYEVPFKITYKDDLGYQTEGTVTLIHNDKKLEVAKLE